MPFLLKGTSSSAFAETVPQEKEDTVTAYGLDLNFLIIYFYKYEKIPFKDHCRQNFYPFRVIGKVFKSFCNFLQLEKQVFRMSFLAAHRPNYFKFLDNEKAQNTSMVRTDKLYFRVACLIYILMTYSLNPISRLKKSCT